MILKGGCHCGNVEFEVTLPEAVTEVLECNCSICSKKGFLHLIVPRDRFRLLTPWRNIETYRFNTMTADHHFCRRCGIHSFYAPRSHPDSYSVNARCVEGLDLAKIPVRPFDGKNWEDAIRSL